MDCSLTFDKNRECLVQRTAMSGSAIFSSVNIFHYFILEKANVGIFQL